MSHKPLLLLTLLLTLAAVPAAHAQTQLPPWQMADQIHDALFNAQKELVLGQPALAASHLATAEATLADHVNQFPPAVRPRLTQTLAHAAEAIAQQDTAALAVASGQWDSTLYWGSYLLTAQAIQAGDVATAQQWLLVRDYRPSTRVSRPTAEATLALQQAATLPPAEVWRWVEADLLDTYQAQLTAALQTAADPSAPLLGRAQAVGRAQGYWPLLAPAYATHYGATAEAALTRRFEAISASFLAGDTADLAPLLATLAEFRAAPLSPAAQARRASQLLRFLALVPVEYGRGVADGVVLQPLEIQEGMTFMAGAQAAFADLQLTLAAVDAAQTAAIATQLAQTAAHLQAANRQTAVLPEEELAAGVEQITADLRALFPEAWLASNSDADFDVLASVLDQMEAAVRQGDYTLAESARLEGYAIFDFGPEPRLLAFAPELVAHIDGLFWQGYEGQAGLATALALKAPTADIAAIRAELDVTLAEAQRTLGDLPSSPIAIATNAAIIVFREGLEAVVILAALMASMVGAYRPYRRPMVAGVALSFVATAATWWLAQVVLTSLAAYGERLEAIVSLVAIGVLLLITNWFFHKTYWKDWMTTFHQQKHTILTAETGQMVGLVLLGFTSTYREGFETVLFLQALVLDAGSNIVLQGVALGLLGVALVGFVTFRIQQRLPYKQMLVWTGVLIGMVLMTMVGKTVHVMQAVGWLGITPIQGLVIPYWAGLWFGLYATWQAVGWQLASAVFVLGSYFGAEWLQARQRRQRPRSSPSGLRGKTN